MDISQNLDDFLTEKVEPNYEKKKIEKENNSIRTKLQEKLGDDLVSDFLMGSYVRNTLTRRINKDDKYDVDIMIVFDDEKYSEYDLDQLLQKTEDVCNEIKSDRKEIIEVRKQKVSVGLLYDSNFKIDIVPAVELEDEVYTIYDSRNQIAIETNPKQHNENLSKTNKENDMKLVPLIKLIKRWKEENYPELFKSFHLESLAIKIFRNIKVKNYAEGLENFFKEATKSTKDSDQIEDIVNPQNDISSYLDDEGRREEAFEALEKGLVDIEEAIKYQDEDETQSKRALGRMYDHFKSRNDKTKSKKISSAYDLTKQPSSWSN